jgi:hypothetical protein
MDFQVFRDAILRQNNSEDIQKLLKSVENDYASKAVTTEFKLGSDSTATGLDPLKLENLSAFMASVVADNQTIKLSKKIKSVPTTSNIYEIPRHLSHGDWFGSYGNFGEQLGLGDNKRTNHDRPRINIKYQVQNREVSIAQSLVGLYSGQGTIGGSGGSIDGKSYNSALQIETTSGLQDMAIIKNKTFWFGNESVDPDAFDGILELHKKQGAGNTKLLPEDYSKLSTVFDLRGAKLTYGKLNEINRAIMSKWGMADTFIGAPSIVDDLSSADLIDLRRLIQDNNKVLDNVTVGQEITTFKTQLGGRMELGWDFHLERHVEGTGTGENYGDSWKIADPNQKTRTDAPAVPTVTSGTNIAASDALSKFVAADAGDYYYAVAAIGTFGGISKLALINATPVTVAAGQCVNIFFADGAGVTPTKGYVIYRSLKNAPNANGYFYPIIEVSTTEKAAGYDGGSATYVRDRNRTLVKTQDACMFFNDVRIIHSPELLPITRIPLARVQLSDKFALANFYALAMPTPSKFAIIRNIG